MPRRAEAVQIGRFLERPVEIVSQQAGAPGRLPRAQPVGLEQDDVHAGRGEGGGARASRQPAANDGDVCREGAFLSGNRVQKVRGRPHRVGFYPQARIVHAFLACPD